MKEVYDLKNIIVEKGDITDAERPFALREVERKEIKDLTGKEEKEGVYEAIKLSTQEGNHFYRGLCKHTGDLKFIIGVCRVEGTKMGVPWFLTSETFKPDIDFIRGSRGVVHTDMYLEDINVLCNYIHVGNTKSIKWLKWLGFQFTAHPYLNDYHQFYRYKE